MFHMFLQVCDGISELDDKLCFILLPRADDIVILQASTITHLQGYVHVVLLLTIINVHCTNSLLMARGTVSRTYGSMVHVL